MGSLVCSLFPDRVLAAVFVDVLGPFSVEALGRSVIDVCAAAIASRPQLVERQRRIYESFEVN